MTIQLQVDGTQLVFPTYFRLPGSGTSLMPDGGWDSNSTLEILTYTFDTSLPPGLGGPTEYTLCVADDVTSTPTTTVGVDGTISMNIPSADYFEMSQTAPTVWRLKLKGFPVTLDARYLSTSSGIYLVNQILPNTPNPPFRILTARFLPGGDGGYGFEVGSGLPNYQVGFNVDTSGNITYAQALDVSNGGLLRGAGGKVLEFLGFPILIDARQATTTAFGFAYSNDPNSDPSVMYLNLVPYEYGFNEINGGPGPVFSIGTTGELSATGTNDYNVSVDNYRGMGRLSVFRRLDVSHPVPITRQPVV